MTATNEQFQRTAMLLGQDAVDRLARARVIVFGVGGVGGFAVEALARCGVGALDLVDKDAVDITNLNRQIIATHSSVGRPKVEVARDRVLDINPDCDVRIYECFFLPETADQFDFSQYDYVVDAVDTVSAKLQIVVQAKEAGVPVISSMGAGNKLDPTRFRVTDVYDTSVDKLAKVMRRECRKRGVDSLKVVYSTEEPLVPRTLGAGVAGVSGAAGAGEAAGAACTDAANAAAPRRSTPGSVAFVPSVVGLIIAGEVVKDLVGAAAADAPCDVADARCDVADVRCDVADAPCGAVDAGR